MVGWALSFADVTAVDAESVSKKIGASFHWFPVQKSFILVTQKDTARFAVGIPYASVNGSTIDLTASPVLEDGHLWIAEEDVGKLFPPKSEATAAKVEPAAKTEPAKAKPAAAPAKADQKGLPQPSRRTRPRAHAK